VIDSPHAGGAPLGAPLVWGEGGPCAPNPHHSHNPPGQPSGCPGSESSVTPTGAEASNLNALLETGVFCWNSGGLSMRALGKRSRTRKSLLSGAIARNGAKRFVFLQETKANAFETSGFCSELPGHKVFYNNLSRGKAGTIIAIPKPLLKRFRATVLELPGFTKGHAHKR
jgi:hypothetical protein